MSAGADAIVAHPTTITGSIGVVFGKLNVRGLYELIGANVDTIQLGENADLLSFVESFDDDCPDTRCQSRRIEAWIGRTYEDFKGKVASGRDLEVEAVEAIAKGRIWSGTDALEHGLIDRLGGYDEASELICEKLGIAEDTRLRLVPYPRPQGFFELLFEDGLARSALVALAAERQDPVARLSDAIEELARPGVWLLTPKLEID